jgi:hypothetical protein
LIVPAERETEVDQARGTVLEVVIARDLYNSGSTARNVRRAFVAGPCARPTRLSNHILEDDGIAVSCTLVAIGAALQDRSTRWTEMELPKTSAVRIVVTIGNEWSTGTRYGVIGVRPSSVASITKSRYIFRGSAMLDVSQTSREYREHGRDPEAGFQRDGKRQCDPDETWQRMFNPSKCDV